MNTVATLAALSGLCWMIVYVDCLRLGIKQRTYAIPCWALALNLAWEGVHTVAGLPRGRRLHDRRGSSRPHQRRRHLSR